MCVADHKPWRHKLRTIPPAGKLTVQEIVEKNIQMDLVDHEAGMGAHASRSILVRKSSGRHQLAPDLRDSDCNEKSWIGRPNGIHVKGPCSSCLIMIVTRSLDVMKEEEVVIRPAMSGMSADVSKVRHTSR